VAIFFSCLCGQQLRAEESGAAGFTRCLACSRLVPIPSVRRANEAVGIDAAPESQALPLPAPALTIPPLPIIKVQLVETAAIPTVRRTPRRRTSEEDDDLPYALFDAPENGEAGDIQGKVKHERLRRILAKAEKEETERRRRKFDWKLEKHWYEFPVYPLRATFQVMTLSVAWATVMALLVAFLPETGNPGPFFALAFIFIAPVFLLLGYTFGGLQATLSAASKGQAGYVAWPGNDLGQVARGAVQGVLGFLAGPIVPVAVAIYFWQESGDLEVVDWLILLQLSTVAAGYWALVMLAIQQKYAFLDANPVAVFKLVQRQGYRVLLTALFVAAAVVGHSLLALDALEQLHRGLHGWVQLVSAWIGLLFCLILALRWFGVSCYWARKGRERNPEETE
jgi:hypothetical protein